MSQQHPAAMTVANDQTIIAMIHAASRRVVLMAPGITMPIAQAIGQKWMDLGGEAVAVILDVDPEVCRMGYGEIDAIKHLEPIAASLSTMVNHHAGLRIGVVIADDETLIYAPTPLLIEAGPPTDGNRAAVVKPNAIRMSVPPADVERDLGMGLDGDLERTIGLDMASKTMLKRVDEDLAANPPQRFDISRSVRVFNAQFEFVEFELKGAAIERKTVRIPNDLLGLGEEGLIHERLRAKFNVVDPESTVSGKHLHRMKQWIIKRYLTHLPGYGFVVLRRNKAALETAVKALTRKAARFERQLMKDLQKEMDRKRKALVEALLPHAMNRPPEHWKLFSSDPDDWEEYLDGDLIESFGQARDLFAGIKVRLVFKAVTYESLTDPKFCELVRSRVPTLTTLHTEFDAAKGAPLPPRFDAQEEFFKGAA